MIPKIKLLTLSFAAIVLFSCCRESVFSQPEQWQPVDYVSTLVGTASEHSFSTGNTYPAVALPWGMNFWTPQTGRNGNGWAYTYNAKKIRGFKQTHQPSPWINDYASFSLMPVTTGPYFDQESRASWFSHKAEIAKPYYYQVYLAEHDALVELSPTQRAAVFRITYPQKDSAYLVVDAMDKNSFVQVLEDQNKVVGYTVNNHGGVAPDFKNWFVIESDTPFQACDTPQPLGMLRFKTEKGQQVNLKVASSFISAEQAEQNLKEVKDKDLEQVCEEGRQIWNEMLGRIKVEDGNIDNLRTFYSCLYRSLLFPRDLSEIDAQGRRLHYSPHNGKIEEGYFFTDTGFWDTFRSLFPLLNLVYPDVSAKVQDGLVNTYLESGFLPEWASPGHRGCMVGNNSASVVADAYLSGIRDVRVDKIEKLWEAVTRGAHSVHPTVSSTGRMGWELYDSLGYVPCDAGIKESAARTLEYAYDDWCIYQLGKALGKSEEEIAPYRKAAGNYKNLYNPEYRLMVGRKSDGSFNEPFSPLKWGGDFTEGNSLHYTWSVFADPQGLIDLMGGEDSFNEMMDSVFEIPPHFDDSYYGFVIHEIREMQVMNMGNYAHGNQPVQHMIYLYDWSRQPWKAQARVREVMDKFYNANYDGYCGDEDNGQTSAWYVFSALGFYPVCPGSGEYALGTPLFKKATVRRPDGTEFVISAPENSSENFYVKELKINGKNWDKNYVLASDLKAGAKLNFTMSAEPNYERGVADTSVPYSMTNEK